ncbi:hypothetical protein [Thermococcus sp.]|uniref:hypothetical protein n=1 Tax=Thermococcus sp. TaxID=35749 RepID=UPI0025DFBC38|nr:hypothetical protein [Thermococcus sp.]
MDPVESRVNRIGDDHVQNTWLAAYHTMPYDRLIKEKLDEIAQALWEFGGLSKAGVDFGDYIQYLKTAARAAEKIGEMQAKTLHYKGGKYVLEPLNGKIEQIEEMHQLAEYLKKLLPEKIVEAEKIQPTKFKQDQKQEEKPRTRGLPEDAKVEVLSILQALEFADYSEKAKKKALQKFSERISELSEKEPTRENLLKLGLYTYALELVKASRWEKVEKLREL